MQPPPPPPVELRPPANPPGAAPPANWKSPLKELYNRWLHVDLTYDTSFIEGVSSQSTLQHRSRVRCPAISYPSATGEEELLLAAFTCEGYGRSRKDAEQNAAAAALHHISSAAPALGVVGPAFPVPPPSIDGTLRSTPSPSAYYPHSAAALSSTLSPGGSPAPTSSAASTADTTGGRSTSQYASPRSSTPPAEPPAGPEGHAAGGSGVDAAELQSKLQRLVKGLRSIRQAIDDLLDEVGSP